MTKTGDSNRLTALSHAQWNARTYRTQASQLQNPNGLAPGNLRAMAEVDGMVRAMTGQFMSDDEYRTAMSMLHTARNFGK
ncbi:MAG: hypothetical protein H6730_22725 [Deltaproteobacteria bacterium]|nr:hypothetical protein [Deltaproteobacteria bacterium]